MISRRALAVGLAGMLLLPAGIALGADDLDEDQPAVVAAQDRDRVRLQDRSECESCENGYEGATEQERVQTREQTQIRSQLQDDATCDGEGSQLRHQLREQTQLGVRSSGDPASGNGSGPGDGTGPIHEGPGDGTGNRYGQNGS